MVNKPEYWGASGGLEYEAAWALGAATGVGDLKRVLTTVKTRGTWGEVQLARLIEDGMTPEQYARNVKTVPGSDAQVEFAIRLPGATEHDQVVWLTEPCIRILALP